MPLLTDNRATVNAGVVDKDRDVGASQRLGLRGGARRLLLDSDVPWPLASTIAPTVCDTSSILTSAATTAAPARAKAMAISRPMP